MNTYQGEEEQVQALKEWWKENGRAVIAGLVIGVAVIGGYRYWTNWQKSQAEQASMLYARVITAAANRDQQLASVDGQKIIEGYSGTPYAALTSLVLASLAVEKQDYAAAVAQLQWVLDNSGNDGFQYVARLRLARIMAAQGKVDDALNMLNKTDIPGFASLYNEARGDFFAQQGKTGDATDSYRRALSGSDINPQQRQSIEMKLNDLNVARAEGSKE